MRAIHPTMRKIFSSDGAVTKGVPRRQMCPEMKTTNLDKMQMQQPQSGSREGRAGKSVGS